MNEQELENLVRLVTREVVRALGRSGLTPSGGEFAAPPATLAPVGGGSGSGETCACGCGCRKAPPADRRWHGSLLTEASLAELPPGSRLILPPRTLVTPLARDQARRRGIELVAGIPGETAAPTGSLLRVAFFTDRPGPTADSLVDGLRRSGVDVRDCSITSRRSVQLEAAAADCARQAASGAVERAVIIFDPAYPLWRRLRKIPGLRPVLARDRQAAMDGRRDLNGNVLIIPGRQVGWSQLRKTVAAWIETEAAQT